jgi:hypothetical protein
MAKKKLIKTRKVKERPNQFQSFSDCIRWNKKSVYLIARGRQNNDKVEWTTLGSGFLAAPNRLVTASHVISDLEKNDPGAIHQKDDIYYLLRRDDENNVHLHAHPYDLDKSLFTYPEEDIAIFHLEDSFYELDGKVYADRNNYIPISKEFCTIGTEIGILGYPISGLEFENGDFNKPKIGNVLLRTDQGVVNCRYQISEKIFAYQFTLSFNPGNSGGPIFNSKSGRVISVVKGFNSIIMSKDANEMNPNMNAQSLREHAHATYSVGFATPTFIEIFKKHNIIK